MNHGPVFICSRCLGLGLLSESYTNLTSKNLKHHHKKRARELQLEGEVHTVVTRTGTLHQLSKSMHTQAQQIAAMGLYLVVYSNINIQLQMAEQIIGHHGL